MERLPPSLQLIRTLIIALAGLLLLAAGCGTPPPPPRPPPAPVKKKPKKKKKKVIPRADEDIPAPECAERDKELAALASPYLEAFVNRGLQLSPDGKLLLFLSNRGGGSYQLYVAPANKPRAEPTVIAKAKDGVSGARFTPDGKYILFARDKNKDENHQLFRATPDGKEVLPLTDKPKRFHRFPEVTADGQTLVYLRGSHKSPRSYLVSQPIEGGKARVLRRFKGFTFLAALSDDGARALVVKLSSLSASKLLRVDIPPAAAGKKAKKARKARAKKAKKAKKAKRKRARAKLKRLAPGKGVKAHAHMSAFSADEKSVYVVTDEGGERAGLHKISVEDGAVQAKFYDEKMEVSDVRVSRKAGLLAVLLDAGSHRTLQLLDAATLAPKVKVKKMPLGRVSLGRFSEDGKGLVVTISTPSAPADVFLVSARNGRLKPLRRDKRPGLRKLKKVKATVVRVPSFDKLELPVNVYLPKRLPRRKKLPTIVWVHGGPAAASAVGWSPFVGFWIANGFAVVEPNVRGSTGFGKAYEKADNLRKRMDAVKDLAEVAKWVGKQKWADPQRLVVGGGSYGGYMTYMGLGHQADLWAAGLGAVGIVNMLTFARSTSGTLQQILAAEFGSIKKDRKFLRSISPITVVQQMKDPLFVYQGQNDPRVPRSEQDQLVTALRKQQTPVEYMVAADEGHSLAQKRTKLQFLSRSMRFLEQHLDLPGPPKDCQKAASAGEGEAAAEEEASPKSK